MYIHIYIYIYKYTCIYVYMCLCIYIYIYKYIYYLCLLLLFTLFLAKPHILSAPPLIYQSMSIDRLLRERNPLLFYSERGILYYSTPREESFTIPLRERNPLLFHSEKGILYYSTPREESINRSINRCPLTYQSMDNLDVIY